MSVYSTPPRPVHCNTSVPCRRHLTLDEDLIDHPVSLVYWLDGYGLVHTRYRPPHLYPHQDHAHDARYAEDLYQCTQDLGTQVGPDSPSAPQASPGDHHVLVASPHLPTTLDADQTLAEALSTNATAGGLLVKASSSDTCNTHKKIRVSVNRSALGRKLGRVDDWRGFNGAFRTEEHTPASLLAEIEKGAAICADLVAGDCGLDHHGRWCSTDTSQKSFCPDAGKPGHCGRPVGYRIGHHFKSAQHLALDDDSGNLSIDDLLADLFIAEFCSSIYPTISWKPDYRKWRVLFILDEAITDAQVYRRAATALLDRYKTTDQQVKDPARLFFGMRPGNGEPVFLGNLLPIGEVRKLVSEYEDRRRDLDREANARRMPQVDLSKLTGNTRDERYVRRAIEEELVWLSSRAPGSGERYPSVIPAVMKLESLRLSDWLSVEVTAQIEVAAIVLGGCAGNGSLQHYGEEHLRKAIDWGIAHAEPRAMPASWNQPRRAGRYQQRPIRKGKHRRGYSPMVEVSL